jgi:integrase/recombinase XerD
LRAGDSQKPYNNLKAASENSRHAAACTGMFRAAGRSFFCLPPGPALVPARLGPVKKVLAGWHNGVFGDCLKKIMEGVKMEFIERYFDGYLDCCRCRKKLDTKTTTAYKADLEQFFVHAGACKDISEKDMLNRYITFLHGTYKCASAKRKIASVRAYYNYLEDEGIIEFNPVRALRTKFREERKLPKTLPFRTVQDLLDSVYGQYRDSPGPRLLRDIVVIELLFATGARVSELCGLKDGDINVKTGEICIFGKGARERIAWVCNPEVLAILSEYRQAFGTDIESTGCFFVNRLHGRLSEQSVRHMLDKRAKAAEIPQRVTPHKFRHTFATMLLEEGVDIRYIQKMLGHASIRTTEIYTHVALQKQKEILALKHPRNRMSYSR